MTQNRKAAFIGGGVIGGAWAARFFLNGWDVVIFDPDPNAKRKNEAVFANARAGLPALYDRSLPAEGSIRFTTDMADIADAEYIQESVPERIDLKLKVYQDIQAHCRPDAVLASSTSGFKPSELQEGAARPEQILVCHPFNPVYLLPLVEVVPSEATNTAITAKTKDILTSIGMKPLHVRKEIDAHIADRFLEAVWREGLWLVNDGIATTQEIDDAIVYGFGIRWAQMGLFETYRCAGGEAGMAQFMAQFGPALKWPWTKLMDVPELTDELVQTIADQSDAQSGHMSIPELWQARDKNLIGMMRALKANNFAAGEVIATHEATLPEPVADSDLIRLIDRSIPVTLTDYNGHLNDAEYARIFSDGSDIMMGLMGATPDYIAGGLSYFTVEKHISYLDEIKAGERITVDCQVLEGKGKKARFFYTMKGQDSRLCSTCEIMLIHVDLSTRASAMPAPEVAAKVEALAAAHAHLPWPEKSGKGIGTR